MLVDYISNSYPAGNATDGQYLYRSLGSFWTQIFQDKGVLQGYTIAMAEETIQAYYNLIETVNQYSVKDISLYHKEKWQPLVIKKSEFNNAPFIFDAEGALFGFQPESDKFYANQLFRFGFPKQTSGGKVFSFTPQFNLAKSGVIANRVIAPSLVLVPGVDFVIKNSTIYFKTDLFNNEYIPKAKLVGDFGAPQTYLDTNGKPVEDEFVILWVYMAEIDTSEVYNTFGTLLDISLPTSESYKTLLKSLMNLYVEGPTITALNTLFAALVGAPVIIEPTEVVEDLYSDDTYQYVITDKHVYRIPITQTLQNDLEVALTLHAGSPLTASIKLIDTVIDKLWWKTEFYISKLGFASHVFAADTHNQLFFANDIALLTYTGNNPDPNKKIVFPVTGRAEDVAAFHDYINDPSRKLSLLSKLGLPSDKTSSTSINPVDFLFSNIIKNNTLLLRLDFYSQSQLELFFSLISSIQPYLPPHVYLLVYLKFQLSDETLTNLNNSLSIASYPTQQFSLDGSVGLTGERPGDVSDPDYYKDYINRLFCISVGPYKNGQPLHADGTNKYGSVKNIDELAIDNSSSKGTAPGVKCGLMRTEIPYQVKPPGEQYWRKPSTREVPTILLIDF